MSLPGFTAEAALLKSDGSYRTEFGQASAAGNAGLRLAAIVGGIGGWCRGCWVCEPRWPYYCTCHYPCPIVRLPPGDPIAEGIAAGLMA